MTAVKLPAVLRFVFQHVFATFVIFLVLFNVTTSLLVPAMLDLPSSSIDAHQPLRKKEVCPNMEVRNGLQQFSELEGCRVAGTEIVMVELQPGYIAPHHWEKSNAKSKRLHVLPVIICLWSGDALRAILTLNRIGRPLVNRGLNRDASWDVR
ncbi:uncharacterized protein LOC124207119 isoform X3 [Daphnia pulex]|uniref:uncharacterized protein LOC124207119 isoform X3 n=1 Tax=Daphnia pulex TaxID=6669 RepID=UPI001EE0F931|nr:uncharacterized protein LOC124207119 isoform X3 [Daphnia pulex]XP_046460380.1 uncharacterized protein LOC124207119 isoform X3 [Daphnia pulex]